jgi:hypothetical protein
MTMLLKASLIINILVLIPVSTGLISNSPWVQTSYGPDSPARGILLSIYITILFASIVLLIKTQPLAVITLLLIQIVYKVTTPFTVGTLNNPVVISNLLIALFHLFTVFSVWNSDIFKL